MTQTTDVSEVLKRLDTISTELRELKLEARVFQAQTSEKLDALNQPFSSLEDRVKAQDTRLWGFVAGLVLALLGLLAKVVFFPSARV